MSSKGGPEQCYFPINNTAGLYNAIFQPCFAASRDYEFVPCCEIGDFCLEGNLCAKQNVDNQTFWAERLLDSPSTSPYYIAGCTDPNFSPKSPACSLHCEEDISAEVIYNSGTGTWQCCSGTTDDGFSCADPPTGENFVLPAPGELQTLTSLAAFYQPAFTGIIENKDNPLLSLILTNTKAFITEYEASSFTVAPDFGVPSAVSAEIYGGVPTANIYTGVATLAAAESSFLVGFTPRTTSTTPITSTPTRSRTTTTPFIQSSATPTPTPAPHHSNAAVIGGAVGGSVGGVALILLVLGGCWYARRRRRRRAAQGFDTNGGDAEALASGHSGKRPDMAQHGAGGGQGGLVAPVVSSMSSDVRTNETTPDTRFSTVSHDVGSNYASGTGAGGHYMSGADAGDHYMSGTTAAGGHYANGYDTGAHDMGGGGGYAGGHDTGVHDGTASEVGGNEVGSTVRDSTYTDTSPRSDLTHAHGGGIPTGTDAPSAAELEAVANRAHPIHEMEAH